MDIAGWRRMIDEIDAKLVELLNRRAACAAEIGKLKREQLLEVYSPGREAEVLRQALAANTGPLQPDAIARLFERIIDEARRVERLAHQAAAGPDDAPNDSLSTGEAAGPPPPDPGAGERPPVASSAAGESRVPDPRRDETRGRQVKQ